MALACALRCATRYFAISGAGMLSECVCISESIALQNSDSLCSSSDVFVYDRLHASAGESRSMRQSPALSEVASPTGGTSLTVGHWTDMNAEEWRLIGDAPHASHVLLRDGERPRYVYQTGGGRRIGSGADVMEGRARVLVPEVAAAYDITMARGRAASYNLTGSLVDPSTFDDR